jgi:hypothetical protein
MGVDFSAIVYDQNLFHRHRGTADASTGFALIVDPAINDEEVGWRHLILPTQHYSNCLSRTFGQVPTGCIVNDHFTCFSFDKPFENTGIEAEHKIYVGPNVVAAYETSEIVLPTSFIDPRRLSNEAYRNAVAEIIRRGQSIAMVAESEGFDSRAVSQLAISRALTDVRNLRHIEGADQLATVSLPPSVARSIDGLVVAVVRKEDLTDEMLMTSGVIPESTLCALLYEGHVEPFLSIAALCDYFFISNGLNRIITKFNTVYLEVLEQQVTAVSEIYEGAIKRAMEKIRVEISSIYSNAIADEWLATAGGRQRARGGNAVPMAEVRRSFQCDRRFLASLEMNRPLVFRDPTQGTHHDRVEAVERVSAFIFNRDVGDVITQNMENVELLDAIAAGFDDNQLVFEGRTRTLFDFKPIVEAVRPMVRKHAQDFVHPVFETLSLAVDTTANMAGPMSETVKNVFKKNRRKVVGNLTDNSNLISLIGGSIIPAQGGFRFRFRVCGSISGTRNWKSSQNDANRMMRDSLITRLANTPGWRVNTIGVSGRKVDTNWRWHERGLKATELDIYSPVFDKPPINISTPTSILDPVVAEQASKVVMMAARRSAALAAYEATKPYLEELETAADDFPMADVGRAILRIRDASLISTISAEYLQVLRQLFETFLITNRATADMGGPPSSLLRNIEGFLFNLDQAVAVELQPNPIHILTQQSVGLPTFGRHAFPVLLAFASTYTT